ncbi:MAG TPA: hypothetical protein VE760_01165 [Acidimicrobiales bacterium]|nr:hypothetical protein [Acidimicrobiales bacterium]
MTSSAPDRADDVHTVPDRGPADRPRLFADLRDGRFRRDAPWGRMLHRGALSLREARATDALTSPSKESG